MKRLALIAVAGAAGSLARYGDNVPPYPNTRKYLRMVVDRYYEYVADERRLRVAAD